MTYTEFVVVVLVPITAVAAVGWLWLELKDRWSK